MDMFLIGALSGETLTCCGSPWTTMGAMAQWKQRSWTIQTQTRRTPVEKEIRNAWTDSRKRRWCKPRRCPGRCPSPSSDGRPCRPATSHAVKTEALPSPDLNEVMLEAAHVEHSSNVDRAGPEGFVADRDTSARRLGTDVPDRPPRRCRGCREHRVILA